MFTRALFICAERRGSDFIIFCSSLRIITVFFIIFQTIKIKTAFTGASVPAYRLVHISLLREYVDLEFTSLQKILPFPYDLERIIDDFVSLPARRLVSF